MSIAPDVQTSQEWLTRYDPRPDARIRLICFPHGGGGPQAYRAWSQALGEDVEVLAINLPGRGSRRSQAPLTSMSELSEAISAALMPFLDKPFALFGHSVGALVAYETAARLLQARAPRPTRLILSAHEIPARSQVADPMYLLSDEDLLARIRDLGLVEAEALDNPELAEFILPPLRADFEVSETYVYRPRPALPVPITVFGGTDDPLLGLGDLAEWAEYTSAGFTQYVFEGDHFYTVSRTGEVTGEIATLLEADLANLPASIMVGPQGPYPDRCLHELFRDQARAHPDRVAVVDPATSLTFAELDAATDLLARELQRRGVGVDDLVGIYLDSSVEFVIAYLGILKAGGAYLPLDLAYPPHLLTAALDKAEPVAILTRRELASSLPERWSAPEQCVELDPGWQAVLGGIDLPDLDADDRPTPSLDSLAYCVMTSGTTGEPKGIICPHRGAVNSYSWRYQHHPYAAGEREACNVFLVWEVIRPLLQGYPSYVIPDDVIYDPHRLVEFLETYEISRVLFTPSLLEQVLNTPGIDLAGRLRALRIVWLNGEVVPTSLVSRFRERLPGVDLINDYSISECHDVATHDLANLDTALSPRYASLGQPMTNVRIYLLDEDLRPVPRGVHAEIYVAGDSLARGYLHDAEKTAERFLPDPIEPGSSMFRTGDLGRILPSGDLEVTGRAAFMVKLRGYSIVPGAVEAAIEDHPAVLSSVVTTLDDPTTGQPEALVAYVVSDGSVGEEALAGQLRSFLKDRQPGYAIPAHFIPLDALPLSEATGKLDRRRLPDPAEHVREQRGSADEALSGTPLEQAIAAAWDTILPVRVSVPSDSFFDLGGHSLLAVRICDVLAQRLEVDLSVIDLYEHPTVAALAQVIEERRDHDAAASPQPLSPVVAASSRTTADLAIVGMSGRFPGARDIEEFWENLLAGVCSVRELTDEELAAAGVPESVYSDPDYRKVGALVDDVAHFDPGFWGLSAKESLLMDPQHRLFLQACWHALEHAGYPPGETDQGGRTGVFGGCYSPLYLLHNLAGGGFMDPSDPGEFHLTETGNDKDYLATRVSYLLNLRGPSVSVQTSCSTAAAVVATACQSLQAGHCDVAVAGASSITFPQAGYQWVEGHINSADGQVRAFDAAASGTILGDGVGVVVLKRLRDAQRDGDTIYSVIKGYAVNNDGIDKAGYSAPGVAGQKEMVAQALANAGVSADSVTYVEAHGTGTLIGDPIEVRALTDVYRSQSERRGYCALGSVKPNIGHSNIAAGMAGLIKATMSLYTRTLAPQIHFDVPNPAMKLAESPFYISTERREWVVPDGVPRRAGVSCLGIGGTNVHFVLEEPPRPQDEDLRADHGPRAHALTVSGKTPGAVVRTAGLLADHLERHPDIDLADVAYTLQTGRRAFEYRGVSAALEGAGAIEALRSIAPVHADPTASTGGVETVFVFPGQGSQHLRMGRGLYRADPTYRHFFDECAEKLRERLGYDIREHLFAEDGTEEAARAFRFAYDVQPSIFALQYSLARSLIEWGIVPDAMAGHSIGEYAAACIAGMFDLDDALDLVVARGRSMETAGPGAMTSVTVTEDRARELLQRHRDLSLAVINAPTSMVLSGPSGAVEALEAELAATDVGFRRVNVRQAFHSAMMSTAVGHLDEAVARLTLRSPQIRLTSNLTGTWLSEGQANDAAYWGQHMRHAVRFADNIATLLAERPRRIIEVGSGVTLASLLRAALAEVPAQDRPLVVSCLPHPRDRETPDAVATARALGAVWADGGFVDFAAFRASAPARRIGLPGYSFEPQVVWPEPGSASLGARPADSSGYLADIADRCYLPSWSRTGSPAVPTDLAGQPWTILPGATRNPGHDLGLAVAAAVEDLGGDVRVIGGEAPILDAAREGERIVSFLTASGEQPDPMRSFDAVAGLARDLSSRGVGAELWVVTDLAAGVDQEPVCPAKSAQLGPAIVLPQENPQIACRVLDIQPGREPIERLAARILAEAAHPDTESLISLRGARRWVQRFEPTRLEPAATTPIREGGVYLLTAGFGRIAGEVASWLARSGARIVLATRRELPPREEWSTFDGAASAQVAAALAQIERLEAAGAEVLAVTADMGQAEDVARLFAAAQERFGGIDGIFHLAGVADLRYLPDITDEIVRAEFAPKIDGVRHLEREIAKRAREGLALPEFVTLFSSLAAVLGGYSMAAYASANRVMDAFVQADPWRHGVRWTSVNWDDWDFEYTKEQVSAYERTAARYAMAPAEGIEALQRILAAPEPGQVILATRALTPRVAQWLDQGQADPAGGEEPPETGVGVAERVLSVYREVLGASSLAPEDDFFAAGGDSLLAGQILLHLRRHLPDHTENLRLAAVFDHPSVAAMSQLLGE